VAADAGRVERWCHAADVERVNREKEKLLCNELAMQ